MAIIENMPTLFGNQFYPGGVPLTADKISVQDKTVRQWWMDSNLEKPTVEEEALFTDFYRYYLLAPCWELGDYSNCDIMKLRYDKLFDIALDMGIDPL